MTEGTVKFFDAGKHFGFINGDDGKSYYFHESQVEHGTAVTDGDKVSFTPAQGERGPKAEHVKKLAAEESKESESEESEESESEASEASEEELEEEIAEAEETEEA
jgi:CspA family cold shock protein